MICNQGWPLAKLFKKFAMANERINKSYALIYTAGQTLW